jgi:hypothetical protein
VCPSEQSALSSATFTPPKQQTGRLPERAMRPGTRGSSDWAAVQGAQHCHQKRPRPQARTLILRAQRGPPRRGRVRSQEGAAVKARGGIGCQPVAPHRAPQARLRAGRNRARLPEPSWRPRTREACAERASSLRLVGTALQPAGVAAHKIKATEPRSLSTTRSEDEARLPACCVCVRSCPRRPPSPSLTSRGWS